MEHRIKTRPYTLFVPNKFVESFVKELDAYLYSHPKVRDNAGVARYKSKNRRNEIIIDFDNSNFIA